MKAKSRLWMSVAAVALLAAAGCSSSVPCQTDPSQVETARADLQAAEQQLQSAQAELASVSDQRDNLNRQMNSLPDTADLERRLALLKKGSGR